jgi:hypothetical protein
LENATGSLKWWADAVIDEETRPDIIKHERTDDIEDFVWGIRVE